MKTTAIAFPYQLQPFELIVDNFAGGGGASTGIEMATGRSPDIAINHDAKALALHRANHPTTLHFCEDVFDVSPLAVTKGQPVGLGWFSPDCKHFSRAKGGKPVDKNVRALAWVVVRWAEEVSPRVIFLENVKEFLTWGPLLPDGRPDPATKGDTFRDWVAQLQALGYVVEWRVLKACDFGAPTSRERLFVVARRDGYPIAWPAPTHGPGRAAPYRTAAECIDWTIPVPSIFGRAKPLKENTERRIARGIMKYVLKAPKPFIVRTAHGEVGADGRKRGRGEHPLAEPLPTITTSKDFAVVSPSLIPLTHHGDRRVHPLGEPAPTITGANRGEHALLAPLVARIGQTGGNGAYVNDARDPLTTVTTKAEHLLVAPSLIQQGWGERDGQAPRCLDITSPIGTIVADGNKHALVASFMAKHYGGNETPGSSLAKPLDTITTVDHNAVVACQLQRDFGRSVGAPLDGPAPTTTAGGGGHQAMVASHMVKLRGGPADHQVTAQDLREPAPTFTAGGNHAGVVHAFLTKYYGAEGQDQSLADPLHTITTRDRFGLVTVDVDGEPYVMVDIGMRMLEPAELFACQGFPARYRINVEHNGKRLTKSDQVRMVGNSVCPDLAAALVRANMGAEAGKTGWYAPEEVTAGQLSMFDLPGMAMA